MLADSTVVFSIRGVSGKVQFVLDAPMSSVKCKQAVFVGFFNRKATDAAYASMSTN